jgi:hypothetical protein
MDLAPRRIPIWNPERSTLYVQDAHCRIPGILSANSIGVNAPTHTQRLDSEVRGLSHRKHPARQSSHSSGCLLALARNDLRYWSNIS